MKKGKKEEQTDKNIDTRMDEWKDGKAGRRKTGKKYSQKIKKQRSIGIEEEEEKLIQYFIYYLQIFIIQQINSPYSSVVGLERLSYLKYQKGLAQEIPFSYGLMDGLD